MRQVNSLKVRNSTQFDKLNLGQESEKNCCKEQSTRLLNRHGSTTELSRLNLAQNDLSEDITELVPHGAESQGSDKNGSETPNDLSDHHEF